MNSQASTRQPLSQPRQWGRRRARVVALSLTLTGCAASTLTAAPAWAAGGYTLTATIRVGQYPIGVAVSPDGTRAYITQNDYPSFTPGGSVSVIDTAARHVTATVAVSASRGAWRSAPAAPISTSPTAWRGAPYR